MGSRHSRWVGRSGRAREWRGGAQQYFEIAFLAKTEQKCKSKQNMGPKSFLRYGIQGFTLLSTGDFLMLDLACILAKNFENPVKFWKSSCVNRTKPRLYECSANRQLLK